MIKYDKENFIKVCEESLSMASAASTLGIHMNTFRRIAKKLGDFPHGKLKIPPRRISTHVRPGGKCPKCEYRVPMLKLYLQFGAPLCPIHKVQMEEIGDWNK